MPHRRHMKASGRSELEIKLLMMEKNAKNRDALMEAVLSLNSSSIGVSIIPDPSF